MQKREGRENRGEGSGEKVEDTREWERDKRREEKTEGKRRTGNIKRRFRRFDSVFRSHEKSWFTQFESVILKTLSNQTIKRRHMKMGKAPAQEDEN